MSARFVSIFGLQFESADTYLYLRYSVSYTKIELRHIITYEDDLIKVKTYIALIFEMRMNTQFKNIFNQVHAIRKISKKVSLAASRL